MNVDNQLINYLCARYNSKEVIGILHKNSLYGLVGGSPCSFDDYDRRIIKKRKADVKYLEYELKKICVLFGNEKINYFVFKGVVLGNYLYGYNNCRKPGDIDIFVFKKDFEKSLNILFEEGFVLNNESTLNDIHHVVLKKGCIVVELHKSVLNPMTGINEKFLYDNVESSGLFDCEIKTFNITATFLHLLYHLYNDMNNTYRNDYYVFMYNELPETRRFLYRAYEIALFSAKYFDEINWDSIINDLLKQKFRIIFKKMIFDIIMIFPDAFPQSFISSIPKLKILEIPKDHLNNFLINAKIKNEKISIKELLGQYIDKYWKKQNNICIGIGESFIIEKNDESSNLYCVTSVEKTKDGLEMSFRVSKEMFCVSEQENFDTHASDGVHIMICSTREYSYNSIFFFPKQEKEEIRIIPCDVFNDRNVILDSNLIKASISFSDTEYKVVATLSSDFLISNGIESYFYLGIIVSVCDGATRRRKDELVSTKDFEKWYNPIAFAKIDIKQ